MKMESHRAFKAQRSPVLCDAGLGHQWAGTLCCCGRLERPNHFVGGFIEDVPSAVVLLRALSHPANTTLPGHAPASISVASHSIPPTSTAPYPDETAQFASVSSSSFHGAE